MQAKELPLFRQLNNPGDQDLVCELAGRFGSREVVAFCNAPNCFRGLRFRNQSLGNPCPEALGRAHITEHGLARRARGVHDAPDMFVREMAAGLRRDMVSLLLAAKAGTLAVRLLPDVKDAEGQISHALELSATDLNPIVLYVDPQSSLIRKRVYAADAPGRPLVEEAFFDYRDVDGIQFAFRATQKVGPVSVERRVTDVKINAPIDPAVFKRPAS